MSMCEKCWADAFALDGDGTQADRYRDLVRERNRTGQQCTPREQAGQFWDEQRHCDSRLPVATEAARGTPK